MTLEQAELVRVLCDLGRVEALNDLGSAGPLVASAGGESLFNCLFGRDAIRMAMDLLEDFPAVARATLLELARLQGVRDNPRGEEEPGRILHEHRDADDPVARELGAIWDFPYYGSVDSTPQWINLLGAYSALCGVELLSETYADRLGRSVTLRDALVAATRWLLRRLDDPRGAGFLWVQRASPEGIVNQVWEDSADAYYHADGTLLSPEVPYAPIAPQAYTYDALLVAADLLESGSAKLRQRAARLRERVLQDFWLPELGTFAPALEICPDGVRPTRVVGSSAGHVLTSQLLDGGDAASVRDVLAVRLRADDLVAGAGIRTKSTGSPRFVAGSYHNGSSWPVDSGVVADGLRRHGYARQADDLEDRVLRGCAAVGGFPEFFRGDVDGGLRVNTETLDVCIDGVRNRLEQPPQANQGWTATRVWRILRIRGANK